MSKPLCMDDDEFFLWDLANRTAPRASRAARPCSDCPLAFYHEMRAVNRCDGKPKKHIFGAGNEASLRRVQGLV